MNLKIHIFLTFLILSVLVQEAEADSDIPVFSALPSNGSIDEIGYGILVNWRQNCVAVMPKHVADAVKFGNLGTTPKGITIQIENSTRAILRSKADYLERDDLFVAFVGAPLPNDCNNAPEVDLLLEQFKRAINERRAPNLPINFFINSFGKTANLVANRPDEFTRVAKGELLEYRLGQCSDLEDNSCNMTVRGYSGSPIWLSPNNTLLGLHREICRNPLVCDVDGEPHWRAISIVQIHSYFKTLAENGFFGRSQVNAPPTIAEVDPKSTIFEAQVQLTRLNCNAGPPDGLWGPRSAHAFEKFRRAYVPRNASRQITIQLVDEMRQFEPIACPEICRSDETFASGTCRPLKPLETRKKSIPPPRQDTPYKPTTQSRCTLYNTPDGVEHVCKD